MSRPARRGGSVAVTTAQVLKSARSPALYSSCKIVRWLPFTFSNTTLVLLYFFVCYNLLALGCAIEGVCFEGKEVPYPAALAFALITIPVTLVVISGLDLHNRRRKHLSPTRIIVTSSISCMLLLVTITLIGPCYFTYSLPIAHYCPNGFHEMWAIWYYYHVKVDLAPALPFLSAFEYIFYTLYFVLGLKSRSHDRKAERSIDEENTVPNSASLPHGYWVCGNKSAAKRKHRLKLFRILNDTPEHAIDEELQVQPNYAESRVASKPPSLGHSIAETSLSQGQASDNHDSLLWDSSIPGVSSYEASTIGISTGESSSFVNNSSARSSILISSASSGLPAYNERAPSLQTRDDSSEDQELHMGVSRPELVYIPR